MSDWRDKAKRVVLSHLLKRTLQRLAKWQSLSPRAPRAKLEVLLADADISVGDLLSALRVDELRRVAKRLGVAHSGRRADLESRIVSALKELTDSEKPGAEEREHRLDFEALAARAPHRDPSSVDAEWVADVFAAIARGAAKASRVSGDAQQQSHADSDELREALRKAEAAARSVGDVILDELVDFEHELVWNRLTVALYAPTGAGKSTIIEALTNGDGSSIGDGSKDHTKVAVSTLWRAITLVDTPGIEGAEGSLVDEARRGLSTAHVVAFVSNNKPPEEGTLQKVHQHAKRASEFVSILNYQGRGGFSWKRWRKRRALGNDELPKMEDGIRTRVAATVGSRYTEHVTVSGLLAFVSGRQPMVGDFPGLRNKALAVFETHDAAREMSAIDELEGLLDSLDGDAAERILWSNALRGISVAADAIDAVEAAADELREAEHIWSQAVEQLEHRLRDATARALSRVLNELSSALRELENELNTAFAHGYDADLTDKQLKDDARRIIREAEKSISHAAQETVDALSDEIRELVGEMQERLGLRLSFASMGLPNFEEVLGAASLSLGDELLKLLGNALTVGLAWVFGNPILAGLTLAAVAISRLLDWFGGAARRRRSALKDARKRTKTSVAELEKEQAGKLREHWKHIDDVVSKQIRTFEEIGAGLLRVAWDLQAEAGEMTALAGLLATDLLRRSVPDTVACPLRVEEELIIAATTTAEPEQLARPYRPRIEAARSVAGLRAGLSQGHYERLVVCFRRLDSALGKK